MNQLSWRRPSASVAAMVLALAPPAAHALVVGGAVTGGTSGGAFALVAPPSTLGPDSFQTPNLVAFNELQDLLLTEPLPVGPGLVLGAGSIISSHVVVFDSAEGATVEGTVLFDQPIVGIVVGPAFGATNALLGLPSVTYVGAPGLGPEMNDFFAISMGDPARLVVRLGSNTPGDHLRILTGTVVPEPSAALATLVATAACWGTRTRRSSRS